MRAKPGIMVLCTGNSCRSQMAEALLRHHAGHRFRIYSAGTEPAEEIHPLAVQVMSEQGLDLSGQEPQHLQQYLGHVAIHTLVIVCDRAGTTCPTVWPGAHERLLWPQDDPASAVGSEEERLAKFREVRDALEGKILNWLDAQAEA